MNKKLYFFMLVSVVFTQADKLDSLRNFSTLLQPKLFFASTDNWIPPTLPDDGSCITSGCCIISTGWYTFGRMFFTTKSDTTARSEKKSSSRLNLEIGYSPGICWASSNLMPENPGWLDPTTRFYWLNIMETIISYKLNAKYRFGFGGGYMWTFLENRCGTFSWGKSNSHESTEWKIEGIPLTISIKIFKNARFSYEFQLNYYFIRGVDIEKMNTGFPNPVIETTIVNCWARGWGGTFKLNYENYLFRRLKFVTSSTAKIGRAREYKNNAPMDSLDDARWNGPVDFFVTGMYLNFGLCYEF